jgi:uncharacterized protein YbcI
MVNRRTKGTIEAEIANAAVRFQREQQGRGPSDVHVHLIGDIVLIRCIGILTPTEVRLATTEEGRRLVRSARQELRAISRMENEALVANVVGCSVVRSYSDVDIEAGEQMEVYVLEADIERRLLRQELDMLNRLGPKRGT